MTNKYITFGHHYDKNILTSKSTNEDYNKFCLYKPNGLWACPQLKPNTRQYTSEWSNFCDYNDFYTDMLELGFTFTISHKANILKINDPSDIKPYVINPECFNKDDMFSMFNAGKIKIDFDQIYKNYDGMYVAFSENKSIFRMSIFNAYDVNSLIVWNPNILENIQNFKDNHIC